MKLTLPFYSDPGHGWLAVPRDLLPPRIIATISNCSYKDKNNYYLEEDGDCPKALEYLRGQGYNVTLDEHNTDDESNIRRMKSIHN